MGLQLGLEALVACRHLLLVMLLVLVRWTCAAMCDGCRSKPSLRLATGAAKEGCGQDVGCYRLDVCDAVAVTAALKALLVAAWQHRTCSLWFLQQTVTFLGTLMLCLNIGRASSCALQV
jgi:hypothetical protein